MRSCARLLRRDYRLGLLLCSLILSIRCGNGHPGPANAPDGDRDGALADAQDEGAAPSELLILPIVDSTFPADALELYDLAILSFDLTGFDVVTFFLDLEDAWLSGYAFAYPLRNDVAGIGLEMYPSKYEAGPELLIHMGDVRNLGSDPSLIATKVMAQEFGHRYLAYVGVVADNVPADILLGRGDAHWSFFCDTDGSVMEGNELFDNGDGTFTTGDRWQGYSPLDRYLMGILPPEEVPDFFCVENAANFLLDGKGQGGDFANGSRPFYAGLTFSGTRIDLSVDDVIAAHGPRDPPAVAEQRTWRQAFIVVVRENGQIWHPFGLQWVDRLRVAWETYLPEHTDGLFVVDTHITQ